MILRQLLLWGFSQELRQFLKQQVLIKWFAEVVITTSLPSFFLVPSHGMGGQGDDRDML